MRSARPQLFPQARATHTRAKLTGPLAGMASVLAAAGPLAGCATTQQKAARLRLNDARILVSQTNTRVRGGSPTIAIARLTLVTAGRRTAFVVTVRNPARHAVSDLPISVGYRVARRRPVYLNAGANSSYFAAHLPAIAAGHSLTWVYAGRRLPTGARPFARVGAKPSVSVGKIEQLPTIHAATVGGLRGDQLEVALRNISGIPQYQLPVYALLEHDGRTVAAGTASVGELAGGSTTTLRVRLLGRLTGASEALEAPPTIFH